MATRICDVPIDLDDDNHTGFNVDVTSLIEMAVSSAVSLKHTQSAWSSSSGSEYGDEDPTTSPIDLGGRWYWSSPVEESSDSMDSGSSTYTHDSGYLSRSSSWNKDKRKPCHQRSDSTSSHPTSQFYRREITNCDPSGPQEVMAKRVQSNREIDLLQHLNSSPLRLDPWNPSPPLISIVNADDSDSDEPLAIFEPLVAYDSTPLATVEEALDFFMQLLQGLVFLQENKIVHGDIYGGVVLMDQGSQAGDGPRRLSRIQSNIRYHLVDFTHANIVGEKDEHLFCEDLRALGLLIDKAFGKNLPELSEIILEMTRSDSEDTLTNASCVLGDLEDLIAALPAKRIKGPLE